MTPEAGGGEGAAFGEEITAATAFLACLSRMDIVTGTRVGALSTGVLFKLLRLEERQSRRLG